MNDVSSQPRAKVCILTSVHIPFDGRIFHRQAKSLARAGYDVVLIARHDKTEVIDGVRVVPLPEPRNRLERMTTLLWRLWRLALKERADVYHFHDPELLTVGLGLRLRGKKVIWDVHEHYPNDILDKFWIPTGLRRVASTSFDLFERAAVRFFDYVIYTTPLVGARYARLKVRCGRIDNYPPVELSRTCARAPRKKIIYLGAMSRYRGLVEVVEAFALVARKHPDWELCLVGVCRPASFEEELKALAAERHVATCVKFIPWVPYEQKEAFLAEAAMGLVTFLPYSNNTSCLPNKLFEYMLSGVPVIASDFPLYREVVAPSQCGLLVDPTRPQAVAAAMERLIEHPQEARAMGANGRRVVLERYNWESQSEKLLEIYATVLNGKAGTQDVESTVDRRCTTQLHEDGAALLCDARNPGA
ncbi:MAG: glycosyltransferase family 4 protein [Sedimentisphaerales bacterium]|nr:glycosyltransferase family 4 protein [Sedimentisphaerales bacterium]